MSQSWSVMLWVESWLADLWVCRCIEMSEEERAKEERAGAKL